MFALLHKIGPSTLGPGCWPCVSVQQAAVLSLHWVEASNVFQHGRSAVNLKPASNILTKSSLNFSLGFIGDRYV